MIYSVRVKLRALLLAALFTPGMATHANTFDPEKPSWSTLKYSASKFFVSLHAQVDMQVMSPQQALENMIRIPENRSEKLAPGRTAGTDQVVKLQLDTEYFGTRASIKVWMDTDTRLLQRQALYTGRKNWQRTTRFTPGGAYAIKTQPGNEKEARMEWQQWSDMREKTYIFNAEEAGLAISETEALFYIAATGVLKQPGDRLTFHVFDKDKIIDVHLVAKDWRAIEASFNQDTDTQSTRVDQEIKALRIAVTAASHNSDQKADIDFLGYDSDLNLFIDTERKIILEISGKADYLGTVNIRLDEVVTRPST